MEDKTWASRETDKFFIVASGQSEGERESVRGREGWVTGWWREAGTSGQAIRRSDVSFNRYSHGFPGGGGYTSYNIHASMINKLRYWSIGFHIPPLADGGGRPPIRPLPLPRLTRALMRNGPSTDSYSWKHVDWWFFNCFSFNWPSRSYPWVG